ncbi:class I SAM-dependent methyltransferase [Kribbella sp. CA-247076]|uniref:class I SAM-dependent methyltransferase n=1 Tax=Kribbella sp. CA-247076 TaxID=3239941 RepID=UPI003D8BF57C
MTAGLPRSEVPAAFDAGAFGYDRLVGLNPGYHKHLRLSAARLELPDGGRGLRVLDAGCGTGASTAALLKVAPHAEIVAFDASSAMIERARRKGFPDRVRFLHSSMEDLDPAGLGGSFDAVLAAYLIRNLDDPDAGLRKLRGLLRPGGRLAVHEYSVADSRLARTLWSSVAWGIIIPLGKVTTRDTTLYRHLWRSVLAFDGVSAFRQRMAANGFEHVTECGMSGWQRDVVHTFLGTRPLPADGD